MKDHITKRAVDALAASAAKQILWDTKITGFGLKVTPTGAKSFVYAYRFPRGAGGKMRWYTIGRFPDWTADEARDEAERLQGLYKGGIDPMAQEKAKRQAAKDEHAAQLKAPKQSVEAVVKDFVERYAKKHNRSWEETERILTKHVVAAWGSRQIKDISRSDVNELLDSVEDESGAPMATAVLAQVRKLFNWYATRDDKFNTPIVRGMARTKPKDMARDRTLTDDELRVMWQALDKCAPPYRQLVRFLLLTAQRRDEAAEAKRLEIGSEKPGTPTDLWTIPKERYKTKQPNVVPLSAAAIAQLTDLPDTLARPSSKQTEKRPAPRDAGAFLFTTTGDKPFSGFSKAKVKLDAEMERILRKDAGVPAKSKAQLLNPWRIHDLRRTAKTLMQRVGVRPDISERVLGHVIPGVEGTYDRHAYLPEKRHALNALAAEVGRIVGGESNNVVPIRSARQVVLNARH